MYRLRISLCLMLVLFVTACGQSTEQPDGPSKPELVSGKNDQIGLEVKGDIEFGETIEGGQDGDVAYSGYTFEAKKGASIEVEAESHDSSYMWLFGPKKEGSYENDAIAMHEVRDIMPHLKDVEIPKTGEYLIVLNLEYGGSYTVSLGCNGEQCAPQTNEEEAESDGQSVEVETSFSFKEKKLSEDWQQRLRPELPGAERGVKLYEVDPAKTLPETSSKRTAYIKKMHRTFLARDYHRPTDIYYAIETDDDLVSWAEQVGIQDALASFAEEHGQDSKLAEFAGVNLTADEASTDYVEKVHFDYRTFYFGDSGLLVAIYTHRVER